MLKIVRLQATTNRATLRLEGRVIGPWVDELRRSCDEVRASGATLVLDVGNVAFLGGEGALLLRDLIEGGATVVNCPPFVSEQLKALSPVLTIPATPRGL